MSEAQHVQRGPVTGSLHKPTRGEAASKKIVTIRFEVPDNNLSDLQEMERDGALDDLAECLATLQGRRVISAGFSD